jgi:predicted O-linked N-acetylglucosamine transferase (SPINDLY family)
VGLPELVTGSLEEYERLALSLASEPQRLGELRARLALRATQPLFDTAGYTRELEAAYRTMHQRAVRGEPHTAFTVSPHRLDAAAA